MLFIFGLLVVGTTLVYLGEALETSTERLQQDIEAEREPPPDDGGRPEEQIVPLTEAEDPDAPDGPEGEGEGEEEGEGEVAYLVPGTYPIPDGSVTITPDGSFTGERTETNDYGGQAPETQDRTTISGRIDPSGTIRGTFQGTDTHVTLSNGGYEYDVRDVSGAIEGEVDPSGSWMLSWTGPEPGSQSGQLPRGDVSALLAAALARPLGAEAG
jgi:hypothetical protein